MTVYAVFVVSEGHRFLSAWPDVYQARHVVQNYEAEVRGAECVIVVCSLEREDE